MLHQSKETIEVDVILITHNSNDATDRIEKVPVNLTNEKGIIVHDLITRLKILGFPLDIHAISYFSFSSNMFIYCGNDPISKHIFIPFEDYNQKHIVTLKVRQMASSVYKEIIEERKTYNEEPEQNSSKSRRTKERKIGEVIEKVSLWRLLYKGFYNDKSNFIKMSLDEAASKVGISKKSLDDYLLQIRFGRKFNFNFNEHFHDNFGILRAYVKKKKSLLKGVEKLESTQYFEQFLSLDNEKSSKLEYIPYSDDENYIQYYQENNEIENPMHNIKDGNYFQAPKEDIICFTTQDLFDPLV